MSKGWAITCGKCGTLSDADMWLDSVNVFTGKCHFQCPECGVMIRRRAVGSKQILIENIPVFVPETMKIEEVKQ